MKKNYFLAMLMGLTVVMGACADEKETVVSETAVEETKVVQEPEEVAEPVEVETEEDTVVDEPKSDETVVLNYENTSDGVQKETRKFLSNINVALTLMEKSPFTLDVIKSWFSDFEGSDAQLDVYLTLLKNQGVDLKLVTDGMTSLGNVKQVEENVWHLDIEDTKIAGEKKLISYWKLVAMPGPTGDLVIDITEIK